MDRVSIGVVNVEEVAQALKEAPDLAYTYAKQELTRGGKRFRKTFIRERMSGRPGINWGSAQKVGGNVKDFTTGSDLIGLKLTVKISRLLVAHEEGADPKAPGGGWLYLSRKTGVKGQGEIFAKVKSIHVPARLGFKDAWDRHSPDLAERIGNACGRAVRVAFERRLKAVSNFIDKVA